MKIRIDQVVGKDQYVLSMEAESRNEAKGLSKIKQGLDLMPQQRQRLYVGERHYCYWIVHHIVGNRIGVFTTLIDKLEMTVVPWPIEWDEEKGHTGV